MPSEKRRRSETDMKYFVFNTFAALLTLSAAAEAGKIYTCEVNGTVVYTSRPSGGCQSPDLPPIGRYSSARYDAPEFVSPPQPQRQENKTSDSAKRSQAKAKNPTAPIRPTAASVAAPAPSPAAPAPKPALSNSRRSILETELNNERKALSEAQKSLAQARAVKGGTIDRQHIQNLEGLVIDRQQNIQALQRELGRM